MKKLLMFTILFYLLFPGMWAMAHTGLETSIPKEGEIVTQPLQEVVLTFETEIESLSTMELFRSNHTGIPLNNLSVEGNTMKADLDQELENGSYSIDWKIVGIDGHPIEGKINFQVQLEQEKAGEETQGEEDQPTTEQPENVTEPQDAQEETTQEEKNSLFPILIIVLVVVLIGSILIFRKKK